MKRLSISFLTALLCFSLFVSGNSGRSGRNTAVSQHSSAKNPSYYWYEYPDGWYEGYATLDDEIMTDWIYYGVMVNTSSAGGLLVDEGYIVNDGDDPVFIFLYAHY